MRCCRKQSGVCCRQGVDLALDQVTRHSAFGPALGNHGADPGSLDGKQGLRSIGPRPCDVQRAAVQSEMRRAGHCGTCQDGLELLSLLEPLQGPDPVRVGDVGRGSGQVENAGRDAAGGSALDGQTLAALGAARVDDGAATAGLHADQEAVGTGAAHLGGLVSTFHDLLTKMRIGIGRLRPGNPTLSRKSVNPARMPGFRLQSPRKPGLWTSSE